MKTLNKCFNRFAVRGLCSLLALFALLGSVHAELKFETTVIEETLKPGTRSYAFEFAFENEGDSVVEIAEVKTSCGCTTAKLDKIGYTPGESGVITGTFSVEYRQGIQQQSIRVLTKDLGQPSIRLSLKLKIPQLVTMKPGLLFWRVDDAPAPKTFKVSPNSDLGVEVVSIESDSEHFVLESKRSLSENGVYEVSVSPAALDVSARAVIKVELAVKGEAPISKTVYAHAVVR